MTRRIMIFVGAALLALASACAEPRSTAEQAPAPPAQSAPDGDPAGQSGRTPPEGSTPVPSGKIRAQGLPQGHPITVWTADAGATVGIEAQEGGCGKASAEVAEQTAAQVVITIVETTPKKAEMCTMDIRHVTVTAELSAPLGERVIVLRAEQRTA